MADNGSLGVDRERVAPPEGYRWANGGGSRIGGCNGIHLATVETRGTLCGKYGPENLHAVYSGSGICGSCARVAAARGLTIARRLPDQPKWVIV